MKKKATEEKNKTNEEVKDEETKTDQTKSDGNEKEEIKTVMINTCEKKE